MKILLRVLFTAFLSLNAHANPLLDGLSMVVSETPYSAVVTPVHYATEVLPESHESISVIHAKMETPIRGELPKEIQFTVVSNIGDTLGTIGKPILVALCQDEQQLYFAGTGAAFSSPTPLMVTHAQSVVKQLDKGQTSFALCEQ